MPLLQALRAGTADVHTALEARLDAPARAADLTAYGRLLSGFRAVHAPLERALADCTATAVALPDWAARVKTPWLDADLHALGLPVPPDAEVPRLVGAEDVVGTSYVLEGATLGGAVLLRGLPDGVPRRFFTSYDERRGAMWHAFRRRVEALEPALHTGSVVAAARRAFAAFGAP